jgi:hypothetical protein
MRHIATWLVVALLGSFTGCTKPPPVNWPAVAMCAEVPHGELFERVAHVVIGDSATETVLEDRAIAELEDLARQHGPATIACVVDEVRTALRGPAPTARAARAPAPSPENEAAVARCTNFLSRTGTTVERPE